MNIFTRIRQTVTAAFDTLEAEGTLPAGLPRSAITVEPPRDAAHGDVATNAAMVLAKPAKMKPRDLADALVAQLARDPAITEATVAGPGFINLRLKVQLWQEIVPHILTAGRAFGQSDQGQGKKINVEYVSANPTGPLHVGHTRGAVFGDALAGLLDYAGFDVTREYYINDGGAQVDTLARSVYLRYLQAHGQKVEFPDGTYPGEYLVPVGEALKNKVGDSFIDKGEQFWLEEVRTFSTEAMMELVRADLDALGVKMDVFYSEKSLYGTGRIEAAIQVLEEQDLIYQPREQLLFRSTKHGDDVDRPIQKSDGAWTYFAPDIAYHYDKLQRADELIDIFGADHSGYVKRMKAACKALSDGDERLDIKLTQLVKLFKDGTEFKMSKRAGTFVTLRDVIDEVGADVTRFVMLTRKNDAPLDFDFDKVLEQSKDNPVYYVQYAQIAEWPRQVRIAAQAHEPHRIAFYLYDLASAFHALYSQKHFLEPEDQAGTLARLALSRACAVTISTGLRILGVTPMEEMR